MLGIEPVITGPAAQRYFVYIYSSLIVQYNMYIVCGGGWVGEGVIFAIRSLPLLAITRVENSQPLTHGCDRRNIFIYYFFHNDNNCKKKPHDDTWWFSLLKQSHPPLPILLTSLDSLVSKTIWQGKCAIRLDWLTSNICIIKIWDLFMKTYFDTFLSAFFIIFLSLCTFF